MVNKSRVDWDELWDCPSDEVERVQAEFMRTISNLPIDAWDDEYERKRELEEEELWNE